MRISEVDAILLRGNQKYGSTASKNEATDNGDWQLLVRVGTDEGLEGWSDVETLPSAAAAVISGSGPDFHGFKPLRDLLIGENPLNVEELWDKMYVGSAYYGRRGVALHCISAIDNCLWSIRAQAANMSLSHLIGSRRRDTIIAYASTLFRDTPAAMFEAAKSYVDRGFRAVKFGWGVFGEDSGRDVELVAAARQALGADRELLIDPGWYPAGWKGPPRMRSRRENMELCERLAPFKPGWVEDFIHPDRFDEYAAVRRESSVPIAAGEQVTTLWDFERFIGEGCVDIIQPDLSRCGGLTVARQVARLAERANIDLVPHSWLTDLLSAYSLHLIATLPRARFVELNVSQSELTRGVARQHFTLNKDGTITIPTTAGLGVDVDKDFIAAHRAN
jgi:L-rhamnonate dehydratase